MNNYFKLQIGPLNIYDAIFCLTVDTEFNKIHVLDMDAENARTVTNAVCPEFFAKIAEYIKFNYNIDINLDASDIYLYHSDGFITEWSIESGEFKPAHNDPHLYPPFRSVAEDRAENF